LMPNEGNLDAFRRFADTLREEGMKANGFAPYLVIQAHHAGRYAKPRPFAARRHPESDRKLADFDGTFVSDDELKTAEEHFGSFSRLAKEAGFDAADVKCCHGYLPGELTSAFERPGEYGGCFENRIRFMRNAFAAARAHASRGFAVTARIGICDGVPRPYGFGTAENGEPEMEEPVRLLRTLYEDGLRTVSLTVGNPCFCLHMNRPFERGPYEPPEDPLVSVARGISLIGEAKRAVPGLEIWAAGISYLGRCAALAAAGAIEEGLCDGMLFGRMMIAYPDFPKEIASDGSLDPRRVCIACGRCEDRIRRAETPVCAVREASRKDAPRGSEE
ncbi:MAG: flavin oxidoreductase/NADH oxidase, partial [Clostridiales bacterium]|nr:flavin oxidoreductase/NADH oxidase [Clostridiales bacterium]